MMQFAPYSKDPFNRPRSLAVSDFLMDVNPSISLKELKRLIEKYPKMKLAYSEELL
jgi:hypothetical protein